MNGRAREPCFGVPLFETQLLFFPPLFSSSFLVLFFCFPRNPRALKGPKSLPLDFVDCLPAERLRVLV